MEGQNSSPPPAQQQQQGTSQQQQQKQKRNNRNGWDKKKQQQHQQQLQLKTVERVFQWPLVATTWRQGTEVYGKVKGKAVHFLAG